MINRDHFKKHATEKQLIPASIKYCQSILDSFTDECKEMGDFEAMSIRETLVLKPPKLDVEEADFFHESQLCSFGENRELVMLCGVQDGVYMRFGGVDLKGIKKVNFRLRVKGDSRMVLRLVEVDWLGFDLP